jgi:transcriptional regulator with XRE-family HTH domain
MLRSEQLRAARALLGWNQQRLATQAQVGVATIRRIEAQNGAIRAISDTVWRLQTCLEDAGIEFIDEDENAGAGARFSRPSSKSGKSRKAK